MIRTIIFDLGNVLVAYDHGRILTQIGRLCGRNSRGAPEELFRTDAIREFDTGRISSEEFFATIRDLYGLRIGFGEFSEIWNSTFLPDPIISESLISSLAANHKLMVLSDTNPLHFEFIRREFPILRHFEDFVISYEVGHLKPSPEIFETAVERAGCPAEECLFIDDRLANAEGAIAAGLNAFQFVAADQFESELLGRGLLSEPPAAAGG